MVMSGGGMRSENVGMSNVMEVKTLHTEYPRFPVLRQSRQGESVLRSSRKAPSDGYQVNIPELYISRYYLCGDASQVLDMLMDMHAEMFFWKVWQIPLSYTRDIRCVLRMLLREK
jgi:hypothetical protein